MDEGSLIKAREIEDRIKYLEDCQEAICKHLGIVLKQEIIIQEKGEIGFTKKEEKCLKTKRS